MTCGGLRRGIAGPDAIGEREPVGEPERGGGEAAQRSRRGGRNPMPQGDGTDAAASLSSAPYTPRRWPNAIRTTSSASRRDATADPDQGRLAPAGPDQPPGPDRRRPGRVSRRHAADGRDQRRLRRADPRCRPDGPRPDAGRSDDDRSSRGVARRRGGPPPPKPTRPVTGRVDMSGVYRPRNQAASATAPAGPRCPASRRKRAGHRRPRAAARLDADRAARPRPGPPLPPPRRRRRSRRPRRPSCRSASSTTTRSARSPPSSRPTSTGSPGPSTTTRTSSRAARVVQADLDRRGILRARVPSPDAVERRGRTA